MEESIDFVENLQDLLVKYNVIKGDPLEDLGEEDPIVKINDSIIATGGNIIGVAGPPKSGKSSVISAILTGALRTSIGGYGSSNTIPDTLGFTVKPNSERKAVIHIDTEQSRKDHQKVMNKVLSRAGIAKKEKPDFFYSFSCRPSSTSQKMAFVRDALAVLDKEHKGIHLIVIDGIADFVNSVNEEIESNGVVDEFLRLSEQYNVPIILVIHYNPGTVKTRGHLGSQLERKAQSVIKVSKRSGGYSVISPVLLRSAGDFNELYFEYNKEKDYHVLVSDVVQKKEKEKDALYLSIAKKIFEGKESISKKQLLIDIKREFKIGKSRGYDRYEELLENNIIVFDEELKAYKLFQST